MASRPHCDSYCFRVEYFRNIAGKDLNALFPNVSEGDEIVMSYVPGKGTVVTAKGAEKGTIEGKDSADALFAVWLGPNPVQEDLKKALLGA